MNNKKLIKQIERFLSYRGPNSIAKQWSTTNEEAKEISNNCWKWFESSPYYDKYLEYKEAVEEVMHKK